MNGPTHLRVKDAPPKPLLIWDGDCHFCRSWIERWRILTQGRVEYAPSQEVASRFPEISGEQFQRSVVLIERDGQVSFAAEAVCRSLRYRPSRRWLAWSYDHIPAFAAVSEFAYGIVAHHRMFFSRMTRLLWGEDVRPPTYFWARRWFLRTLGFIYLIAFVSLWVQVDGLIGENGILPVTDYLSLVKSSVDSPVWLLPTLCWINSSNAFLHILCGSGVVLSLLLILGIAPGVCLVGLFVSYLSLTVAGQDFLSFQWDILLLETGFLAIFFAPWRLWPKRGHEPPVSRGGLFLLKLLLFKLMLMSGVVKLAWGDPCWWDLTALDYHYWSQPLPTVFAWWADLHPEWFKKFSVAFCMIVEIGAPFFIWAPRRLRLIACGLLIFLQIAIALTGNYCFFNLLTIALCLLLIDDSVWRRQRGALQGNGGTRAVVSHYSWLSSLPVAAVLLITLPVNGWHIFDAFKPGSDCPQPIKPIYERIAPFCVASGYGLFRTMTKDRKEIIFEGSADGIDWRPYEFKWKPGDPKRAPGWCAPHQPRLDWQMWFAALNDSRQRRWFERLAVCLLEGKPDVIKLLERNPFPAEPPRYLRAEMYRYRFTDAAERRSSGAWWKRQQTGEFLPQVSLDNIR